jgi:hypothetical protein
MYKFGHGNPPFYGTKEEWEILKKKIAWWSEKTSNYPFVSVVCPHCSKKGYHILDREIEHFECTKEYECPGYAINKYVSTP